MKKSKYWQTAFLLNLFFLFGCFAPTQISAQTTVSKKLTPREIAQQTLPSTVLLVMGNEGTKKIKSGSGFFVAEDIVATNFHVIKDTTEGYAKIYGQEKIYKVLGTVGIDEKNDLALLKLSEIKGKPLKLNTDDSIAIGDEVFAVGNPEGLEGTFSQGIVSSIRKTNNINLLQITASISAGSSGGAVLNDKGEVVGVAIGAIESGQSLNFAVPVSFLRSLILNKKTLAVLNGSSTVTTNNQINSKNEQKQSKTVIPNKPQTERKSLLLFGIPDVPKGLLGNVKFITESFFTLEMKFDKWELGKLRFKEIRQYDIDGYEVSSEYIANDKSSSGTLLDFNYKVDVDLSKEVLPYSAKRLSYYDYRNKKVVREYYSKCGECPEYKLHTKRIIKYEADQITTFDSNGKILEKTIEQNEEGKINRSYYDGKGKLTLRKIEETNGNRLIELYNQNGKVKYKEIYIKNNNLGEEVEETWSLGQDEVLKLIGKIIRKNTETEDEIITVSRYFNSQGKETGSVTSVNNKKLNVTIRENGYSGTQQFNSKYEFEFDSTGNWIEQTYFIEVAKFGKTYFEPSAVTKREIAYY